MSDPPDGVPESKPTYRPIETTLRKPPPKIVYHYTSQEGLLGILKRKVLWLSSIRHLNDSAELKFAAKFLRETLKRKDGDSTNQWRDACHAFSNHVRSLEKMSCYVGSFSEKGDLLSQWRAYTGEGVGFSIGFDFAGLDILSRGRKILFQKCAYGESERDEIAVALMNSLRLHLRNNSAKDAAKLTFREFQSVAPRLKHPSFEEEVEWRLVTNVPEPDKDLFFRPGRSMLIPYREFDLKDARGETPISEIIIGPTPHAELSGASLKNLLAVCREQKVRLVPSSIPYRNW
jgi:hypothetical protein